ncbi:E3 ubiquitin-protein ligase rnf213-alpha-like [Onychostoma macrolepis]|uniref:E3 ubiquitin-protein ligase rnf213-alpha-like n=1 Tax=Onychostoma macrolepis TaxID=369639 RepID=UPI00272AE458|nr:E3 ubiquitin-protein ligase rnf213-alpha-like [Onychostoma macrolepis]XP_058627166.1 E3 ubiquitin-protein ligase rnf213-alpha-like [Onychostoma macrolepis]
MKCPQCNHVSSEKAKFCCECGNKLSSLSTETAPDKSQDKSQSSSNIAHGPDKEKTDIRPESEVLGYHSVSVSPTRPNEDINNESQSSSNIPHGPDKEKTDIRPESEVLGYHSVSVSPTQPNEDINNSNPKKEKNHGSSVDPPVKPEHSQEQLKSVFTADQKYNESVDAESQYVTSPKR